MIISRDEAKNLVVQAVIELQGCKSTQLVVSDQLKDLYLAENASDLHLENLLADLVANGQLIEIEYELPNLNCRIKSFYLPKGTTVRVFNGHET